MAKFNTGNAENTGNTGNTGNKRETAALNPVTLSVSHVKAWDSGVTFTLNVDRVSIYGCRIVSGKNGDFISFPSRKGSDGKYYNHAYINLTDRELMVVFDMVRSALNGN